MPIYAKILADSLNIETEDRLTTMEVEYPLYIHNEIMTHRAMSKNSASSRAIPVAKRLQRVLDDPVIPTVWPKNEPGMSASINLTGEEARIAKSFWLAGASTAVTTAKQMADAGVHKQIANRVVEPWCWMKTIISATEWENFFSLRCAKDAHPDLQELAFQMLDVLVLSKPEPLMNGEWHIPFGDWMPAGLGIVQKTKVAIARCARISYLTQDGVLDVEKDYELYDRLLASKHMSPFEHVAFASAQSIFKGNFKGWIQHRKCIEGENRRCDLRELHAKLSAERSL